MASQMPQQQTPQVHGYYFAHQVQPQWQVHQQPVAHFVYYPMQPGHLGYLNPGGQVPSHAGVQAMQTAAASATHTQYGTASYFSAHDWQVRCSNYVESLAYRAETAFGAERAAHMGYSREILHGSMSHACSSVMHGITRDNRFFEVNWSYYPVPPTDVTTRLAKQLEARDALLGPASSHTAVAPGAVPPQHAFPSTSSSSSVAASYLYAGGPARTDPMIGHAAFAPTVAATPVVHTGPTAPTMQKKHTVPSIGKLQLFGAPNHASLGGASSHGGGASAASSSSGAGAGTGPGWAPAASAPHPAASSRAPDFLSLDPSQDRARHGPQTAAQPSAGRTYGSGTLQTYGSGGAGSSDPAASQGTKKGDQSRKRKRGHDQDSTDLDASSSIAYVSLKKNSKKKRRAERLARFSDQQPAGGDSGDAAVAGSDVTALMAMGVGLGTSAGQAVPEAQQPERRVEGSSSSALKPYFRLTGAVDESRVRPLAVLRESLALALSAYATGARNYVWAWSYLKSIRQDCVVQRFDEYAAHPGDRGGYDKVEGRDDGGRSRLLFLVRAYEAHARVAAEQGDITEFNQCQTQLLRTYQRIRESGIVRKGSDEATALGAWVREGCTGSAPGAAALAPTMPRQEEGLNFPSAAPDRLLTMLQESDLLAFEPEFVALRILYAVYAAVAALSSSRTSRTMRLDASDQSAAAAARATLLPLLREISPEVLRAPAVQAALEAHRAATTGDFVSLFRTIPRQPGVGGRVLLLAAHAHRVRAIAAVCSSLRPGLPVASLAGALGYRCNEDRENDMPVSGTGTGTGSGPGAAVRVHCCLPVSVDYPAPCSLELVELLTSCGAAVQPVGDDKSNSSGGASSDGRGAAPVVRSLAAEERACHEREIAAQSMQAGFNAGASSFGPDSSSSSSWLDQPLMSYSQASAGKQSKGKGKGKKKNKKKNKGKGKNSTGVVDSPQAMQSSAEQGHGYPLESQDVPVLDGLATCSRTVLSHGMDWVRPPVGAGSYAKGHPGLQTAGLPEGWVQTGWGTGQGAMGQLETGTGSGQATRLERTSIGAAVTLAAGDASPELQRAALAWVLPADASKAAGAAEARSELRCFAPQERCRVLLAAGEPPSLSDLMLLSGPSQVDIHGPSPIAMDKNG